MATVVDINRDQRPLYSSRRWIRCADRLPGDGNLVETKRGKGDKARCFLWLRWIGDRWMFPRGGDEVPEKHWPTHWAETREWIEGEGSPWKEHDAAERERRTADNRTRKDGQP